MSVDILMYKVHPLTQDELNEIRNRDLYDVNELGGYELRTYPFEEMTERPARFEQVKDYMRTVELMHTTTDYKACAIAHDMPVDTNSYSICHNYGGGVAVSFNGGYLRLTRDDLDEFTTTTKKTFHVMKRECLDVDVDNWVARELMIKMAKELGGDNTSDLSYVPIRLTAENCRIISKALVDAYDRDELYPNTSLAEFMIELLRAMQGPDSDVFIEFQN